MQAGDNRRADEDRDADQALQRRLRKLLDRFWQSPRRTTDDLRQP